MNAQLTKNLKAIRRDDTLLRYPGNGDNWHMSWAADDKQYVSLCDGAGFSDQLSVFHNSRMITLIGDPPNAKFEDLLNYPSLGSPDQRSRDTRYYNFGTLALDGRLYQFMSTFDRPLLESTDEKASSPNSPRFNGVKLIYSRDNGRTWSNQDGSTPVIWESWHQRSRNTMVFYDEDQESFSLLSVLQMGKNYEHNLDGYIYVYSPNGNTDGTMNELVLFRTPRRSLLQRESYEYFSGNSTTPRWTKDIFARRAVHTFPRGWVNKLVHPYAWHPSVVYNAPLGVYMMANWGMGTDSDGMWFSKPSYFGLWMAATPWGPWTQIHEESEWTPGDDRRARAYQPQIAPKWISPDGKSFWIVWTDFQGADSNELKSFWIDYTAKAGSNAIGEADVIRKVSMMREHMPHYTFNTQRVDLVVP